MQIRPDAQDALQARGIVIKLADGSAWRITAEDGQAACIVSRFMETMRVQAPAEPAQLLRVRTHSDRRRYGVSWPASTKGADVVPVTCTLRPAATDAMLGFQLRYLSLVVCLEAQKRGGLLLHGALAEREGEGVILAGPAGVGKTTASRRLEPPWHSLSDDLTLIARDAGGNCRAHPWPTWSRFMGGGNGGCWDVQRSVPLRCIFFLSQAGEERVASIGTAESVCLLVESVRQAWSGGLPEGMEKRECRIQWFENVCAVVRSIPCYILRFSRTGPFRLEIEKVLHTGIAQRRQGAKV